MNETYRRKCGCTYRSESAASVRNGHELGGYLIEACEVHKKARVMEDIPDDIQKTAFKAAIAWLQQEKAFGRDAQSLTDAIGRAIWAERKRRLRTPALPEGGQ